MTVVLNFGFTLESPEALLKTPKSSPHSRGAIQLVLVRPKLLLLLLLFSKSPQEEKVHKIDSQ